MINDGIYPNPDKPDKYLKGVFAENTF